MTRQASRVRGPMYGDTEVMRKHAGRLREQGGDIRALADQLVAQAENVHWTGRAAEEMRERMREHASRLRDVATRHETAAETLSAHVEEVDDLKDSIAQTERRAHALTAEAQPDLVPARFDPPPPGHKDWLGVTLPGV